MAAVRRRRVVALVGGIAERLDEGGEDGKAEVRVFGSVQEGGDGELRRLLASLRGGRVDEVWILTCWIGHSQSGAITRACKKLGIPVRRFGGRGQARRAR